MNLPKKSLGQHWLSDEGMLDAIVNAAELSDDDTVLEVGPGLGTLTTKLVGSANEVVAVEFDEDLAHDLPTRVSAENLKVVHEDILEFDLESLPAGYKVVANIPYYLTSHLIRRLLEATNQPSLMVLLVQKEVAERIVAEPGQMSVLAVASQHFADTSLGIVVPAEYFDPPPKVDSQVVILRPHTRPEVDEVAFFKLIKAGFGEKRKKLANSLSGRTELSKDIVIEVLQDAGLEDTARAQELSLEQWYDVFERVQNVRQG